MIFIDRDRLEQLAQQAGLVSREHLASLIGIQGRQMRKILSGSRPSMHTVDNLCYVLRCRPEHILVYYDERAIEPDQLESNEQRLQHKQRYKEIAAIQQNVEQYTLPAKRHWKWGREEKTEGWMPWRRLSDQQPRDPQGTLDFSVVQDEKDEN